MAKRVRRLSDLFARCVATPSGCWEWQGATTPSGYGKIGVNYTTAYVHRVVAYSVAGRESSDGEVLHSCDNPRCCNPSHLRIADRKENMKDAMERGRTARGDRLPHTKLAPDQVASIRSEYRAGEVTMPHLARKYGVSTSTICDIIHRKRWTYLVEAA